MCFCESDKPSTRLERGCVVKSKTGHDAGSFYVVLSSSAQAVTIADGRRRKSDKPKRKNVKHLATTAICIAEQELATDKKIRQALWALNHPACVV